MTEREKYRTLGLYFGTSSRNYEKAIENYQTLLSLYPADDTGHNNLAMSYFSTRRFAEALEEGRRALEIYPHRLLYRGNCALFAMYAGDFAAAEDERGTGREPPRLLPGLPRPGRRGARPVRPRTAPGRPTRAGRDRHARHLDVGPSAWPTSPSTRVGPTRP